MIRSSALLTVTAIAMLVAGVFSASLGLIYASIAVSILAALTLGAGVLLRRRELFGEAGAGDTRPGWAAAEARAQPARAQPARAQPAKAQPAKDRAAAAARSADAGQAAGDRARAGRGGRGDGGRNDGDRGERPRKAAAGGAAAGSGRWPGAIAAKGGPLTARGGHAAGHAAGRGRSAKSASGAEPAGTDLAAHAPAPRESARGDWTRTESDHPGRVGDTAARQADDRELASRDSGDRAVAGREPAGSGRDRQRGGRDRDQRGRDQAAAWGDREAPGRGERDREGDRAAWPDREAPGRGERDREGDRAAWPDREAPGRGERDREGDRAAWPDREAPGRGERDRDRGAAARAGFDQAGRPDREQAETARKPAAWGDHDQAAHGREQAAAGQQAEAFRLPSAGERTARARSEAARPGPSGGPRTGDDFWDKVSDELTGSGSQDTVRPAWPATAGPRAMGAGATAKAGSVEAGGDEAEPGLDIIKARRPPAAGPRRNPVVTRRAGRRPRRGRAAGGQRTRRVPVEPDGATVRGRPRRARSGT